jgi:hypothetical protein
VNEAGGKLLELMQENELRAPHIRVTWQTENRIWQMSQ